MVTPEAAASPSTRLAASWISLLSWVFSKRGEEGVTTISRGFSRFWAESTAWSSLPNRAACWGSVSSSSSRPFCSRIGLSRLASSLNSGGMMREREAPDSRFSTRRSSSFWPPTSRVRAEKASTRSSPPRMGA